MPFPAFEYCIVCEQVRMEANNKLAILGFYGVAPTAEIMMVDLEKPAQILFIFGLSLIDKEEQFKVRYEILKPEGSSLISSPLDDMTIGTGGKMVAGFGYAGVFDQEGRYTIVMSTDKAELFRTTFNVRHSPKER
jgi:hypothetical protein